MARSPLTSAVLAEARQRPTRLLLTGLAVVVATLFTAGTFMFADTLRKGLELQASVTSEHAAVVVKGGSRPVDEDLVQKLRAVPGVAEAAPFTDRSITVAKAGGTAEPGYWDIHSDSVKGQLARYSVVTGTAPSGPGQVALTVNSAKASGLAVGAKLSIAVYGRKATQDVTVTAIVKGKRDYGSTVVATPDGVKAIVGRGLSFDQVALAAAGGVSESALLSAVRSAAGTDVTVETGAKQRAAEVKAALSVVDVIFAILSVFTGVALVAAALVVASTFRIVVAQRRRRTALMRCVGASRGQVLRSLMFEAALSGVVAGVVGVLAAVGLGYAGLAIAGNFTEDPLPPLQVSVPELLLCVLLATVVTMIAALSPAIGGTRVPPIAALGAAKVTDAGQARFTTRMVFAALFTLAAVGLLMLPVGGKESILSLAVVAVSGLMAFFALIAAGPVIMPLLARLLGGLVRLVGGTPGRLAVGNALRVPKRTANTTTVLTLGVVLVSAVLVGMSSIQASSADRLASQYPAAVQVGMTGSRTEGIDPALAEKVRKLPETGAFALVSQGYVKLGTTTTTVAGMDVASYPPVAQTNADEGALKDLAPGTVAVSRTFAEKFGVKFGQTLPVAGDGSGGGQQLQAKVIAIYRGNTALGSAVLHPDDLVKVSPRSKPIAMLVDPAGGVDTEKLQSAVKSALAGTTSLSVTAPGDAKAEMEEMFNTMTLIALGLVGMTVLVAVVGVAVTLSLSVVERTQENGLLRALGLTRGGMRATLAWEAVVFGACAAVLGLLLGVLYGALGIKSLGEFDIVSIPYGQLAVVGGGLLLLTLIAAVGPARRSAKTSPLQALAAD
ncbi:FtsX-like permease family protein [Allokutzneria albata]|uniref:Putative ABC transport system permease protein n=1 Tax=Allokutzneria albata TaxID=211114 RepID=A0A1G9RAW0_ALLAB|nr:FtsX-like permease family protein [Allokutzneria albata]SDM20373.1 putative ABC transport system permease protein [Allokutzneria albata]